MPRDDRGVLDLAIKRCVENIGYGESRKYTEELPAGPNALLL